jgi:hypothetical protein
MDDVVIRAQALTPLGQEVRRHYQEIGQIARDAAAGRPASSNS